jgi:hypothetical protein
MTPLLKGRLHSPDQVKFLKLCGGKEKFKVTAVGVFVSAVSVVVLIRSTSLEHVVDTNFK